MQKENPKTESVTNRRRASYDSAMENFNQKEVPQRKQSKKGRWISTIVTIIAVTIGVVLIVEMSAQMGEEQKSFAEVFSAVLPQNALLALGALLAIIILDCAKFSIILHATTDKLHPLIGIKTSLVGRYYDNITPFATGGQPMQIYYLYTKGFNGGLSSAVVMIKYFFNTWAWLIVAFVAMICNTGVLSNVENGTVILIAGWVGWGINVCLPVFLLVFVMMPKFARKCTSGVVSLGHKLKLVKDKEKVIQKAEGVVRDFRSAFIIMSHRPAHLVLLALCCLLELSLSFALPYFVIKMLNGFAVDNGFSTMFSVMALSAFAAFAASVVPTPGNSGALEGLITMAFSAMAGSTLLWVIFTWRFAAFYLYIIIGVLMSLFNLILNAAKSRKAAAAVAAPPVDEPLVSETEAAVADTESTEE